MHYYDFLQNRVMLVFRPKLEEPNEFNPEFELILSKKMNYDHVRFHGNNESLYTNEMGTIRWQLKWRSV